MRILILGALATLAGATAANAQTYTYNYTSPLAGTTGSFAITKTGSIFSLASFNGTINGVAYTASDIGIGADEGRVSLGALVNGRNTISGNTNDFSTRFFSPGVVASTLNFSYTSATASDLFTSSLALTPVQAPVASAVPEPASWAMMIGGFGVIGGGLRTRRRAVRFATA